MGLCASLQSRNGTRSSGKGAVHIFKQPSTIKIVEADGKLLELKQPVQSMDITSHYPSCFLCSLESMSIGACMPHVSDEEELQPGQIYFLLPLSEAHRPLSLPDLCGLAIKASSALGTIDFTTSDSKLVFQ